MAFTIIREDLARVSADAIVVPANKHLTMDGGTGLAVARAAGRRRLQRACKRLGGCPVGQAVATPAFKLDATHIIHAVGPVWRGGDHNEAALLRSAYDNALNLALRLNAQSVALPLLSAGTFGYPISEAFEIAVEAIRAFLAAADMDVLLVLYDKRAVTEGTRWFGEIAEYIDDAYASEHMMLNRRASFSHGHYGSVYAGSVQHMQPQRAEHADYGLLEDAEEKPSESPVSLDEEVPLGFCPRCGTARRGDERYCSRCGTSLTDVEYVARYEAPAKPSFASSPAFGEMAAAPQMAPAPKSAKRAAEPAPVGRLREKLHVEPRRASEQAPDLSALLAHMDDSFSIMLMKLIDARGLTDAQVYKRANISRQHFSKMRKPDYQPTKKTVVALAVALELPLDDTLDLLSRAGFTLSHSDKFDIIVEYFIANGKYDIFAINAVLFAYDQPLLG